MVTPPRDTSGAVGAGPLRHQAVDHRPELRQPPGPRQAQAPRARARRVRAGRKVRYRFGVRNVGNVRADDVRVRVRLPRLLQHLRGGRRRKGSRVVTFSLGRIVPGKGKSRALKSPGSGAAPGAEDHVRAPRSPSARRAAGRSAHGRHAHRQGSRVTRRRPRQRFVAAYGLCRIVIRD